MARTKSLIKRIAELKKAAPGKRRNWPVPGIDGLYVRVTDKGSKSFWIVARGPRGQKWGKVPFLGDLNVLTDHDLDTVRLLVRRGIARIKLGDDPFPPPPAPTDSLSTIGDNFLKRHIRANELITADKIERTLDRLVYPALGKCPIEDIRRTDVVALLDKIEDENGATQADRTLEILRSMFNWHETRDDNFISPIRKGMARTKPRERRRNRVLSDPELRLLWPICTENGTAGAVVQILLLSAQRLEKVQQMQWEDIDRDGLWIIPERHSREKANAQVLPLPTLAVEIIERQTRLVGNPYVFASPRTDHFFNGFSRAKKNLDEKLLDALRAEAMENGDDHEKVELKSWVLHTCRHTAKTLMSRVGVPEFDSERVLGHSIPGVSGHYNHDTFIDQKRAALANLAAEIQNIVAPPADQSVVQLQAAV